MSGHILSQNQNKNAKEKAQYTNLIHTNTDICLPNPVTDLHINILNNHFLFKLL